MNSQNEFMNQIAVQVLKLGPDDVLVLRHDGPLTHEQAEGLRAALLNVLPAGRRCMVIDQSIELAVLTQTDPARIDA